MLNSEQYGELKSQITQVGQKIDGVLARMDAREMIDETSEYYRNYKFEVMIRRECGKYVAEAQMNWAKAPPAKAIADTPLQALQKLVIDFEAQRTFDRKPASA